MSPYSVEVTLFKLFQIFFPKLFPNRNHNSQSNLQLNNENGSFKGADRGSKIQSNMHVHNDSGRCGIVAVVQGSPLLSDAQDKAQIAAH